MFDLKKTITIALVICALVASASAGYVAGRKIGDAEGAVRVMNEDHARIHKTDSLLRRQTETCCKLFDLLSE